MFRLARAVPEVAYTYTTIGGRTEAVDEGIVYVRLKPKRERTRHQKAIEARVDLIVDPAEVVSRHVCPPVCEIDGAPQPLAAMTTGIRAAHPGASGERQPLQPRQDLGF